MVIPLPLNRWWGWLFSELFLEEYLIAETAAMVIQTRASAFIVILLYAMSRYEIGELTELQELCTYTTFLVPSILHQVEEVFAIMNFWVILTVSSTINS